MRIKSACVVALSLFVASTAMAKICKTVGPDGSVTYTDRPVASCDAAAEQGATTPSGSTPGKPAAKQDARPAPGVTQDARTAAIEKAVIGIMGAEDWVKRTHDLCVGASPASARRYGATIDGWRVRNATATERMRRALSQTFAPDQQRSIAAGVEQRNQQQLAAILAGSKDSQVKWCDQTADEVDARRFDLKQDLVAPLAAY